MIEKKWKDYASAWSKTDSARDDLLKSLVVEDVTYTDPHSDVAGRAAFSALIGQFQKDVPGARFEIVDVKSHHGKSLAHWRLFGKDGAELMQGTSFAAMADDGRFTSFSGFF